MASTSNQMSPTGSPSKYQPPHLRGRANTNSIGSQSENWRARSQPAARLPSATPSWRRSPSLSCSPSLLASNQRPTAAQLIAGKEKQATGTHLSELTEQYKVSEFRFRYWLGTQALQMPGFATEQPWPELTFEGYTNLKWPFLLRLLRAIRDLGNGVPDDALACLDGAVQVREESAKSYFGGADENHQNHIDMLKQARDILTSPPEVKKSLEEKLSEKTWRRNSAYF